MIQSAEPYTMELTRLCTDGTRNAASFLLGAARRATFALGYKRLITYTLEEEGGREPARRWLARDWASWRWKLE